MADLDFNDLPVSGGSSDSGGDDGWDFSSSSGGGSEPELSGFFEQDWGDILPSSSQQPEEEEATQFVSWGQRAPAPPAQEEDTPEASWVPHEEGPLAGLSYNDARDKVLSMHAEWNDPELTPERRAELQPYIEPEEHNATMDAIADLVEAAEEGTIYVPESQEDQVRLLQGVVFLLNVDDEMSNEAGKGILEVLAQDDRIPDELWDAMGLEKPDGPSLFQRGLGTVFGAADRATYGALGTLFEWGDEASQHVLNAIATAGRETDTGEDVSDNPFSLSMWGGVGRGLAELATPGINLFDGEQHFDNDGDGSINFREAIGMDAEAGGRWAGALDTFGVIITDPLTYTGLGVAAKAKVGLDAAERVLGREAADQIRRAGLRRAGLTTSQKADLFEALEQVAQEGIEAGSRRGTRIGAPAMADDLFRSLWAGGKQGFRIGGSTVGPSSARLTQSLRGVVESTPYLSRTRTAVNNTKAAFSPRSRLRAVFGKFKSDQVYRARSTADSSAANQVMDMNTRLDGLRRRVTGVGQVGRREMSNVRLDELADEMLTTPEAADAVIARVRSEGNLRAARFLEVLRSYADLAAMPDDILDIVDVVRDLPGQLDDTARREVLDELQKRYPLTRRRWEEIIDRDYWIPGMDQDQFERAFRESGELEDYLDDATEIVTDINGEQVEMWNAWQEGTLRPEDYIAARNRVRSQYRRQPGFEGALDGVDPVRLPYGLRRNAGLDEAQEMYNQLDLFNDDLARRSVADDMTRALDQDTLQDMVEFDEFGNPIQGDIPDPVIRGKQTDNLPGDPNNPQAPFRLAEEWTEDAPSEAAQNAALRRAEGGLPLGAQIDRTDVARIVPDSTGKDLNDVLTNIPDPLRPRILTEEGERVRDNILRHRGKEGWIDFNDSKTVAEINEMARTLYSDMLGDADLFVADPTNAVRLQSAHNYKIAAQQDFIRQLVDDEILVPQRALADGATGQAARDLVDEIPRSADGQAMELVQMGNGQSYWMDPRVKDDLLKSELMFRRTEEMAAFGKFMDQMSATWATWATGALPRVAFHIRNSYGNWYLNFLRGVSNPVRYAEAMNVQVLAARTSRAMRTTGASFDEALDQLTRDAGRETVLAGRVLRSARSEGVINSSYFDELGRFSEDQLQGRILGRGNPLVKWGQQLGSTIEHNARLAHYISKLNELGDPRAAALSVKSTLFDYNDLTPFERKVLRPVSRFYTFMRKNLGLHISVIARDPGRIMNAARIYETMILDDDGELEDRRMQDWMRGAGYVQGQSDTILSDIVSVGGLFPRMQDSAYLVDLPLGSAAETLSPIAAMFNLADSSKPPSERFRDLWEGLHGLTSGSAAQFLTVMFENVTGVDTFTGAPLEDRGMEQLVMDVTSIVSPVWPYVDRLTGQLTSGAGIGPVGNNTSSHQDLELRHAIMTQFFGITMTSLGEGNNDRLIMEQIRALDAAMKELRDRNPDEEIPSISDLQRVGILPQVRYVEPGSSIEPDKDSHVRAGEQIDMLREFGFDVPDEHTAAWERENLNREMYASTTEVRVWARQNGHDVATSGRIPYAIQEAFNQANQERPFVDPYSDLIRWSAARQEAAEN